MPQAATRKGIGDRMILGIAGKLEALKKGEEEKSIPNSGLPVSKKMRAFDVNAEKIENPMSLPGTSNVDSTSWRARPIVSPHMKKTASDARRPGM